MRTGTVVSYSVEKGWGFIRPDYGDGKDLFVHISDLRGCAGADLVSGTRVTFGIRFNKQRSKYRAVEVRLRAPGHGGPVNPIDGDHHFRSITTTCSGRWRPGQQGCGRA
ncbi:cold-shock protein [Bradyrhizobium liaoningense]